MKRSARLPKFAVALGAALLAGVAIANDTEPLFVDTFQTALDGSRWEVVRIADAKRDRVESGGGKLTLALDTLGTDDATVKLRGIRTREAVSVSAGVRAETTIDWNGQANGCYLTAGFAFAPADFEGDPRQAPESVTFEWIGVPPGKNVRPYLTRHKKGALIELYTEGWPQREDRVGRAARKSKVALEVASSKVRLLEDGKELWNGDEGLAGKFRLCLFVTGHSNYPERTVFFENVMVSQAADGGK